MNRRELAEHLAIARAEYEKMVREQGGTEENMTPVADFVKSEGLRLALAGMVTNVRLMDSDWTRSGKSYYGGIDFEKLTVKVEAILPRWRVVLADYDKPLEGLR